jgi:hypothetical protein
MSACPVDRYFAPGRLLSLWEIMLRIQTPTYLALGERIQSARGLFKRLKEAQEQYLKAKNWIAPTAPASLTASGITLSPIGLYSGEVPKPLPPPDPKQRKQEVDNLSSAIKGELQTIHGFCTTLKLAVSLELLDQKIKSPPKTVEEFDLLISSIKAELRALLFLFIPGHRTIYFDKKDLVSDVVKKTYPEPAGELRDAANCLATGFYTAAVFHSMRAIEIGMKALAVSLGVQFNYPIEQADWANIIDQMESKIKSMKEQPKSAQKDADQKFYSEAAMQFRYFKDGWRVRVSHARENYDEPQAMSVIDHAISFFEILASRPLAQPAQ